MVEQRTCNAKVGGSNPLSGTVLLVLAVFQTNAVVVLCSLPA